MTSQLYGITFTESVQNLSVMCNFWQNSILWAKVYLHLMLTGNIYFQLFDQGNTVPDQIVGHLLSVGTWSAVFPENTKLRLMTSLLYYIFLVT